MPSFLSRRSTGKAFGVWRDLSQGDKKLIGQLVVIAVASIVALLAAGRYAERVVLESESELRSARVVEFLHENLAHLSDLLVSGRPSVKDMVALRHALQLGEAFRYKLYDAQGRVVVLVAHDALLHQGLVGGGNAGGDKRDREYCRRCWREWLGLPGGDSFPRYRVARR